MTRRRIAFTLGTMHDAAVEEDIASGRRPRPEYTVFHQRTGSALVTFADAARSPYRAPRLLARYRHQPWALASHVLARRREYDALLASGEDIGLPLLLLARVLRSHTPVAIVTHGSYFQSPKFRLLVAALRVLPAPPPVRFLCLSETLRRIMVDCLGVPAEQAVNGSYGVDAHFFAPRRGSESRLAVSPPVVVSAGTANRDYRTLLRATASLPVHVRVAADSAWFPSRLDISGESLPGNVEVRSFGTYSALRDLYADAAVVVVPLYPARHACGYAVIAEAMAMGKAVIATRTAAHDDFVVHGETGFYVEPGDAEGLRARVQQLIDQPDLAREMGAAARARVERHFAVERYCERLEDALLATVA